MPLGGKWLSRQRGNWDNLKKDFPLIISFYTPKYKQDIERLKKSLDKFNLAYFIGELEGTDNWIENTNLKPWFIKGRLLEFKRDVVWLDADSEVIIEPLLFEYITADLALYIEEGFKANTGTMYFKYNDAILNLLTTWIGKAKNFKNDDQHNIPCVLGSFGKKLYNINVVSLPKQYCQIFDIKNDGDAVILQHQASRKFR